MVFLQTPPGAYTVSSSRRNSSRPIVSWYFSSLDQCGSFASALSRAVLPLASTGAAGTGGIAGKGGAAPSVVSPSAYAEIKTIAAAPIATAFRFSQENLTAPNYQSHIGN
jgi:hypothetical protein